MARTQKMEMKTINSITFNKDCVVDREVISKINAYCSLPENEGLPPTSVIRNFLLRKLGELINQSQTKQAS